MKDYLQDLIQHTNAIGDSDIDVVKIVGTDKETKVLASADNRTLIIFGTFNNPIADFIGTFGMPNLNKLKTILSFDDYNDESIISVVRGNKDDPDVPVCIRFQTKDSDFMNDYRLMSKAVIDDRIKTPMFRGTTWNVEFEPTVAGIQRLKKQSQANSEEQYFSTSVVKNELKINFGDPTTHNGNFVFHSGVKGTLSKKMNWPAKIFQAILDLPGEKKVKISDVGITEISVDSGIAQYQYMVLAQSK